ncbi:MULTISPECIES: uroporphyrinogen-III synthase [Ectothiorhodospira]|nr:MULTISPECIES: uroporphyrinogen-III synthase [Ectothiorhodospira]MCG5494198.1 uroporphyrinogen-III synthase [Ectothiorhodospira variabilis]MCG5504856.1 uroporphyrinogen-III synthase [Ectothiorhodospira variabilis]MCG5508013.1 uroporphyrinogen-III synthase [Ectothiorhodospira variabilis]MCG5525836.1 uroporphyrinogen-III synthase [Ectothiorhodospira haloalkaliphila]
MSSVEARATAPREGAAGPLQGVTVMVTRPAHQADRFCQMVEESGGQALRFPTLEIKEARDTTALDALIDRLEDFHIAVFVSPNAVNRTLNRIHGRRQMPSGLKLATVGRKSAQALERLGYQVDICPPSRFDSEALLEQPELQDMQGREVVIFRGDGGRELLGATLTARGARVTFVESYRRGLPDADTDRVLRQWSRGDIHVIAITSSEGLRNLYEMVGKVGQFWLRGTPLVVGCERMLDTAREMGFKQTPVVAADPSDEAMLEAVQKWAEKRKQTHE